MVWTKLTAGAAIALPGLSWSFGLCAAAGAGSGLAPSHGGRGISPRESGAEGTQESEADSREPSTSKPSVPPAEYRVLVKQHDDAMKAAGDAAQQVYNDGRRSEDATGESDRDLRAPDAEACGICRQVPGAGRAVPQRPYRRGCLALGCREVAPDARLVGPRLQQGGRPCHGDPRSGPCRRSPAWVRSVSS